MHLLSNGHTTPIEGDASATGRPRVQVIGSQNLDLETRGSSEHKSHEDIDDDEVEEDPNHDPPEMLLQQPRKTSHKKAPNHKKRKIAMNPIEEVEVVPLPSVSSKVQSSKSSAKSNGKKAVPVVDLNEDSEGET